MEQQVKKCEQNYVRNVSVKIMFLVIYSVFEGYTLAAEKSWGIVSSVKEWYNDSWQELTEQEIRMFHPFHFRNVEDVVDLHMSCDKPMSNTAAFGITIYNGKDYPIKVVSFDLPVSSGAIKKSFGNKYTLSKTIIENLEDKYITFFNKIFELNPYLKKTYDNNPKGVIGFIEGKPIGKIEALANDKIYGSDINSFLHCEQAVVIDFLSNPQSSFIRQIQQQASKIGNKKDITKITFDIITYNDMCPKCFSTCCSAKEQLIQQIRGALKIEETQEIEFQLIISSFRPYGIDESLQASLDGKKYTRGINLTVMDDSFITRYTRNRTVGNDQISHRPINRNMPLIQFINPFCIKIEAPIALVRKKEAIAQVKQTTAIPLAICANHTREIAQLMQFCAENNISIELGTLECIQAFFELINPDIGSTQVWLHTASEAMKQLPEFLKPSELSSSAIQSILPIRGLTNIGNTCYFNATMQALCASPTFRSTVTNMPFSTTLPFNLAYYISLLNSELLSTSKTDALDTSAVFSQIQKELALRTIMEGETTEFTTAKIGTKFTKGQIKKFTHQMSDHSVEHDSGELITYILDLLKTEAEHKGEFAIQAVAESLDLFVKSTIKCVKCKKTNDIVSQDNILKITLSAESLEQCIIGMLTEEILTMENRWNCETIECTGETTKQTIIEKLPKVLIVQLNRFADSSTKITREIFYTQNLDLGNKPYQLKAVINHHGETLQSGHYTATILGSSGKWYIANDSIIKETEFSVSSDAYILLYEALS